MAVEPAPVLEPKTIPRKGMPTRLSLLLADLAREFAERSLTFEELVRVTQGRAYDILLIILSLPFVTPVPLPFLSTALGSVIALIGMRLALGQRPWLPKRVLRHQLEGKHLVHMLSVGSQIMGKLESVLRPRLHFVHTTWVFQRITGVLITISGMLLLLPLPIPFSNMLPALVVIILAAGALERDGVFFFAGCALFVVNVAFFGAIFLGSAEAVAWLLQWSGWGSDEAG